MPTSPPHLSLPAGETIAAGSTAAVTGLAYADSFAAANPGAMYLRIADSAGVLRATTAAGTTAPGSGTGIITLSATYADVTAVLASLSYAAPAGAGTDTIAFDLWDQAGLETAGGIPVSITAGGTSASGADTWTGAVSSDWNDGANWSASAAPGSGAQVLIPGGTPHTPALSGAVLTGETIALTDGGGQGGSLSLTDVILGAGTVLRDAASDTLPQPAVTLAGTLILAAGATLAAESGSLLALDAAPGSTAPQVVNHGTIIGDGGHVLIDTGGTVRNDGVIAATASGGVGFDFGEFTGSLPQESIVNTGTLIAAGGTLFVNGTVHGGALQFSGAGGIVLEQPNALADRATIAGFGLNDTLQLYLISADSLSFANGVLTVTNAGSTVASLPMSGSYDTANFKLTHQPSATFSNVISYVAGAVAAGPQISVPAGETVAAGGTLAVGGVSVADSFAAANPGSIALNVTAGSGAVWMTDSSGVAVPGAGTGAIHISGNFSQINADLATLRYAAAGTAGADSITVDVWDQAGLEGAKQIAVTVTGGLPLPPSTTPPPSSAMDETIVSTLNGATINAGSGNNTIFASGTGDTITTGDGNNVIQAYAGGDHITTGAGNDTIRIAGAGSTVDAGGGANRIEDSGGGNTLVLPDAGQGSDGVYGYVLAANDLFDLRHALSGAGWNGVQSTLSQYLSVGIAIGGADATIAIAPGGQGAGAVLATLHGSGAITLADFLAHAVVH